MFAFAHARRGRGGHGTGGRSRGGRAGPGHGAAAGEAPAGTGARGGLWGARGQRFGKLEGPTGLEIRSLGCAVQPGSPGAR